MYLFIFLIYYVKLIYLDNIEREITKYWANKFHFAA